MKNKKQFIKKITGLLFVLASFSVAFQAKAFSMVEGLSSACMNSGNCTICDFLRVFHNFGRFIFVSMSGIALLYILWNAIGMILNWGVPEKIAGAKKGITNTLLAVLIILLAWTLVNAIGFAFLRADVTNRDFWSSGQWWVGPDCNK